LNESTARIMNNEPTNNEATDGESTDKEYR